jgi:RND family efflux transporter MFP subunit
MKSFYQLSLAAMIAASASCDRKESAAAAAPPPPLVTVAKVTRANLTDKETFTGRIEPMQWTEIRPRVTGHIESISFQAGQLVNKGDVLFQIDPRWYQAGLDAAEAEIIRSEAAMRLAARDAARSKTLSQANAISNEENDSRVASYDIAKATNLAAIAARDTAKLDFEQATVRAPISGRVSRALFTEGNYVAGPITLLTTIASTSEMYIYTDIDEANYLRLQQHLATQKGPQKISVRLSEETEPITATIESLDNRINSASGSILLRATVPNPDGKLTPGLFARVEIPLSAEKPAILVSESAIGTDQSQKFVLVVDGSNQASYRPIKLGPSVDGKRVVRDGLSGDETIIVNGLQRVQPGATVQPEFAKESEAVK